MHRKSREKPRRFSKQLRLRLVILILMNLMILNIITHFEALVLKIQLIKALITNVIAHAKVARV
jgi:hypothetical protein